MNPAIKVNLNLRAPDITLIKWAIQLKTCWQKSHSLPLCILFQIEKNLQVDANNSKYRFKKYIVVQTKTKNNNPKKRIKNVLKNCFIFLRKHTITNIVMWGQNYKHFFQCTLPDIPIMYSPRYTSNIQSQIHL